MVCVCVWPSGKGRMGVGGVRGGGERSSGGLDLCCSEGGGGGSFPSFERRFRGRTRRTFLPGTAVRPPSSASAKAPPHDARHMAPGNGRFRWLSLLTQCALARPCPCGPSSPAASPHPPHTPSYPFSPLFSSFPPLPLSPPFTLSPPFLSLPIYRFQFFLFLSL